MRFNLLFLGLAYLFYYGHLGVIVPFLSLYLDGKGFSSEQIGELMAIVTVARIIGPNLWSTLADKTQKRLQVFRLGACLTFLSFLILYPADGFWYITLAMGLVMMFWTAMAPQMETIALNTVSGDAKRYSVIRMWGSVGFILFSIVTGFLVDRFGAAAMLWSGTFLLAALFLMAMLIKYRQEPQTSAADRGGIWQQAQAKPFVLFIVASILLQFSFAPYYNFFALYMADYGYSASDVGWLVSLGVAAEVVIFLIAGKLLNQFGIKLSLIFCMLITALRWFVLGTAAEYPLLLLASQCIHAFSFGLAHAASMKFIHSHFEPNCQGRGQALYVSLSFGIGGAFGSYVVGQMWQQGAGALSSFVMATMVALLAALVVLFMPNDKTVRV